MIADYAANGFISHWRPAILPVFRMVENFSTFGFSPIYMKLTKYIFSIFHVGIWQLRLLSFIPGLASLVLFILLLKKLQLPEAAPMVVLFFMLSQLFFWATHVGRYEGLILLITMLNFFWLYNGESRFFSILCGLSAFIGWGIHSAIGFFFAVFPFAIFFKEGWGFLRSRRYYWWMVGILLGALIVIPLLDTDNMVLYIRLEQGHHLEIPPIFKWGLNLLSIFENSTQLLVKTYVFPRWSKFFLGSLLTALVWQARRFRSLSKGEQSILTISLFYYLSYSLLTASVTTNYQLYLIPWLLINLFLVVNQIASRKTIIDWVDIVLFILINLYCVFISDLRWFRIFLVVTPLIYFLGRCSRSFILVFIGLIFGLGDIYLDDIPFRCHMFFNMLPKYPDMVALLIGCMALAFVAGRITMKPIGWGKRWLNVIFSSYFIFVFAGKSVSDIYAIKNVVIKEDYSNEFLAFLSNVGSDERIVAPDPLWFNLRSSNFQGIEPMFIAQRYWPGYDPLSEIVRFNPKVILCYEGDVDRLTKKNHGRNTNVELKPGREWMTPIGCLRELTISS